MAYRNTPHESAKVKLTEELAGGEKCFHPFTETKEAVKIPDTHLHPV